MGTVIKNRGTSCVGVRKTGTTLIHVSTVMGTLYSDKTNREIAQLRRQLEQEAEQRGVKGKVSIY